MVVGDFNSRAKKLSASGDPLGERHALSAHRIDNGDRILQLCADNHLFLSRTSS